MPIQRSQTLRLHMGGNESAAIEASGPLVFSSEGMRRLLTLAQHVAPTSATVLLLGETGVGKEMFAEAIHEASPRRHRPMVRVCCAAIPSTLLESQLFGHERGAFTDAVARQIGRFEAAHGSTLFLDEIGELPLEMQAKLLRAIQEGTIERLGGGGHIDVDVRIIAATNRELDVAVKEGTFREDLYHRLNVFPLTIPPLRDRPDDIAALTVRFIDQLSRTHGKRIDRLSPQCLTALQQYAWPGNVRELRNVIERAIILAQSSTLTLREIEIPSSTAVDRVGGLSGFEYGHIRSVLERCGWRVRGLNGAANELGLKPTTLESRMTRMGIRRPAMNLS